MIYLVIRVIAACALVLSCLASSGCPAIPVLGNEGWGYFANHRILRFHRRVDHGGKRSRLFIDSASVIIQERKGVFWVGSLLGLYTYDEKRGLWFDFGRDSDERFFRSVKTICQDKLGRIWLKSLRSEVRYFDGRNWHHADELHPPAAIPADNTVMFAGRDDGLWFVTAAGLTAFDGSEWSSPVSPPDNVQAAYTALAIRYSDKRERSSMERSSIMNDAGRGKTGRYANELLSTIYCGLQANDGSIWLGSKKAIIRFEPSKNAWTLYPLRELFDVRLIYEDRQRRLWFADQQGHLSVYSGMKHHWKSYDLKRYFPQVQPREIESIYQDKLGQCMIGTADGGLVIFLEKDNKWKMFGDANSTPPVYGVNAIAEDKMGRIWMSVGNGILVLDQ